MTSRRSKAASLSPSSPSSDTTKTPPPHPRCPPAHKARNTYLETCIQYVCMKQISRNHVCSTYTYPPFREAIPESVTPLPLSDTTKTPPPPLRRPAQMKHMTSTYTHRHFMKHLFSMYTHPPFQETYMQYVYTPTITRMKPVRIHTIISRNMYSDRMHTTISRNLYSVRMHNHLLWMQYRGTARITNSPPP